MRLDQITYKSFQQIFLGIKSFIFTALTALPAGWVRTQTGGTLTFNSTTGMVLTNTIQVRNAVTSSSNTFQTVGQFTISWIGKIIDGGLVVMYNTSNTSGIGIQNLLSFWRVTILGTSITTTFPSDTNEHTFKIQRLENGNIEYYVDTTLIYTYTQVDTTNYTLLYIELERIGTMYIKSFSVDVEKYTYKPDLTLNTSLVNNYSQINDIALSGGGYKGRFNKAQYILKNATNVTAGTLSLAPLLQQTGEVGYVNKQIVSGNNTSNYSITATVVANQNTIVFPKIDIDGAELAGFQITETGEVFMTADLYVTLSYEPND